MWYAWTCPWGRVSANSSVKPQFWAFETRKERDDFVNENCVDSVGNCVCDECTRAEMTEYIGTQFLVSDDGRVRKAYRSGGDFTLANSGIMSTKKCSKGHHQKPHSTFNFMLLCADWDAERRVIMTLEEARKLGFKTFTDMDTENICVVREENTRVFKRLAREGKLVEAQKARKTIEKEMQVDIKKMHFRNFIASPISAKEGAIKALSALKETAKTFDGKVFNKVSTSHKFLDVMKKKGYCVAVWVSDSGMFKFSYANDGWQYHQDYDIGYIDDFTRVKEGQTRPRFCFEDFAELIDSTIDDVESDIEKLENSKNGEAVEALNAEIEETRKKLEKLQERARETYDEEAVKALYHVSYAFFHRY